MFTFIINFGDAFQMTKGAYQESEISYENLLLQMC